VVTAPPVERSADDPAYGNDDDRTPDDPSPAAASIEGDEGTMSRINLRMPDHLKVRVEQAAGVEGLSVNAWLVRAATAALERTDPDRPRQRRSPYGAQRYTGWAR
jgi:hypothetical protein